MTPAEITARLTPAQIAIRIAEIEKHVTDELIQAMLADVFRQFIKDNECTRKNS